MGIALVDLAFGIGHAAQQPPHHEQQHPRPTTIMAHHVRGCRRVLPKKTVFAAGRCSKLAFVLNPVSAAMSQPCCRLRPPRRSVAPARSISAPTRYWPAAAPCFSSATTWPLR